jgi:hypothetical protein
MVWLKNGLFCLGNPMVPRGANTGTFIPYGRLDGFWFCSFGGFIG